MSNSNTKKDKSPQQVFIVAEVGINHNGDMDLARESIIAAAEAGAGVDGTDVVPAEGGTANIFMCVADDQCKPGMVAWRQPPRVESGRDRSKKRDEFDTTSRWGVGPQRVDTLGVVVTSATATA